MGGYDDREDEELPAFGSLRTRLQRVRDRLLPPVPKNINDVDIQGEWSPTWSDERFLLHLDNNWGIALFTTNENLRILQRCDKIYIDGTLRSCPQPYQQFVTLHGKYMDQVLALAMCLLSGETVGHYRQLLQKLKTEVRNVTGHRWRPKMAVCDFEHALMLVIETELPNTHIQTCYFHFCQSLWRKIQALGLVDHYKHTRRVRRVLRKLMAIGHLPVALVRQNFDLLSRSRRTIRLMGRYPGLRDFILYMNNTYIQGTFPIRMWNVYSRGNDCRTNNIVEGKNNIFLT